MNPYPNQPTPSVILHEVSSVPYTVVEAQYVQSRETDRDLKGRDSNVPLALPLSSTASLSRVWGSRDIAFLINSFTISGSGHRDFTSAAAQNRTLCTVIPSRHGTVWFHIRHHKENTRPQKEHDCGNVNINQTAARSRSQERNGDTIADGVERESKAKHERLILTPPDPSRRQYMDTDTVTASPSPTHVPSSVSLAVATSTRYFSPVFS
ncbi:hypothetical protein J6590_044712 [Homalodisca vitripennis]|nr:hypothetical protein J6590_044712 [Homalodisca vitripennis]